ncbi:hypothetical protein [uncultured Mucilaginibacter sp.]|uniref:hypothetical protein n=1 Tax=uncultured Mucilaginibacter sp. TaxID=797541 RepID=UPI0025E42342|nr:hypothetical protein [uncultured Mucilaginibacter sp.]
MKQQYLIITLAGSLLASCSDHKAQEKDAMNEVIKVHDVAMEKSEQVVKNNILLDSLIKTKAVDSATASSVTRNLSAADKAMEDWMHQFEVEHEGKSHDEVMQYMADQKTQIEKVNKQLDAAINQSNQYLSTQKK